MKTIMANADSRSRTNRIKDMLTEVIEGTREEANRVGLQPKAEALLETTAEVLLGLRTAYEHYDKQEEPAMAEHAGSVQGGTE
jgi:hypothetical protein